MADGARLELLVLQPSVEARGDLEAMVRQPLSAEPGEQIVTYRVTERSGESDNVRLFGALVLDCFDRDGAPDGFRIVLLSKIGAVAAAYSFFDAKGPFSLKMHCYGVPADTPMTWDPRMDNTIEQGNFVDLDPVLDEKYHFNTIVHIPPVEGTLNDGVKVFLTSDFPVISGRPKG